MVKDNLADNRVSSPHLTSRRRLSGTSSRQHVGSNNNCKTYGKFNKAATGISSGKIIPRCQSVFKMTENSTAGSVSSSDSGGGFSNENEESRKSLYERLTWQQQYDESCQRDLALGRRIGFYKFKSDLGCGNFSKVKMGLHLPTKEKVAVKIIDKMKLDAKTTKMVLKEIAIMDSLSHPHLIRLYEVCETMTNLHLMMEYASGGELFTKLNAHGPYDEREAKSIFVQITSAVEYMHQNKFVHRDLKAENVFFSSPDSVKVGDFGFATQVQCQEQQLNTFCGSPPYAAPELFQDDHYYGYAVDIWALGILLYFMLTGMMPFKGQTVATLKNSILEGSFTIPDYVSFDGTELIKGILRRQSSSRFTIRQIRESNWLNNASWIPGDDSYRPNPTLTILNNPRDEERKTLDTLSDMGITKELVMSHSERGPRSQVIGTYRIILHRFLKEHKGPKNTELISTSRNISSPGETVGKGPLKMTNGTHQYIKKPPKSKACNIL